MKTEGLGALLAGPDRATAAPAYDTNPNLPYKMEKLNGQGVKEAGYKRGHIYIRFVQGSLYRWKTDSGELFEEMLESESPTRFFNRRIKQQFPSAKYNEDEDVWEDLEFRPL